MWCFPCVCRGLGRGNWQLELDTPGHEGIVSQHREWGDATSQSKDKRGAREKRGGGEERACCCIAGVSGGKQPLRPANPQALKQAPLAMNSQKSQGKETCGVYTSAK